MRVIQLGPFPPPHGGVQTNLVAIRNHLRANGHRAGVVHLTRHRRVDADEVYYPENALATARVLLSQPADILHVHLGGQLTSRLVALCLYCALLPGRKSVLTFHSGGFCSSPEGQAITPRSFTATAFRRLDAIIAVNQQIADFFIDRCGVPKQRVHLISPHASVRSNLEGAELPGTLQRFYDAHDPLLLSVSGLEPEYDVALQIEALGHVRGLHPNAGLAVLGSGSLEAELRARVAALPYAEHVLLAGDVPHKSTLRAIRECRIVLRTTHYDGDALSVREALEIGAPVIATDNGMRPPGCKLIPMPPQLQPLLDVIEKVLADGTKVLSSNIDVGIENLDAVLRLYQALLRPGS
ncbi:MAG: glycosyltransferase family 4 protein [Acidobacteriota bacterium]